MYVRRKRFVCRKEGSSGGSSSFYIGNVDHDDAKYNKPDLKKLVLTLGDIAMILVLVVSIPTVVMFIKPMQLTAFRVDPDLQAELSKGNIANAYIVANLETNVPVDRVDVLRVWYFGDIKVIKARLSSVSQLEGIIKTSGVISVYGEKTMRHAPTYYLSVDEYPNFRDVDIDNEFHKADGISWTGRNVTVAIIDTGIDYTHPDFYDANGRSIIKVLVSVLYKDKETGEPLVWVPYVNGSMEDLLNLDMQFWKEYGEPAFLDICGHGTHVAGIVAGRGWASNGKFKGIAPSTDLVIVKAFNKDGGASIDACLDALNWVYNNTEKYDIEILSMSWGAAFASDGHDPLSMAANKIAEKGVFVFAAAGNEGNIPTTIMVPAVAEKVFAVGAWDAYYDKLAPFSSIGTTIDFRMKPDLVASGVMVVSCRSQYVQFSEDYMVGNYYVAMSGTSMATPAAAGIAADFIEYFRYWYHRDPTMDDFIEWLQHNVRHINFVKDFITGYGIPYAPHT